MGSKLTKDELVASGDFRYGTARPVTSGTGDSFSAISSIVMIRVHRSNFGQWSEEVMALDEFSEMCLASFGEVAAL